MSLFSARRSLAPRRGLLLGVGILAAAAAGGCGHEKQAAKEKVVVEVVVTKPITDRVRDYQDFTGRLAAIKTVDIRPRATGYVTAAPFKEGDVVQKGDLLFQIDDRPYQADLNQVKANLKLAEAERNVQARTVARAERQLRARAISQEEYDQAIATLEKDKAAVEAMEATREKSNLYLDWTRVTAPLTGRISQRLVDPGNMVLQDNTVLATVVTEDPIYVYFDVDERTLLDLVGSVSPGQSSWLTKLRFPVLMRLANEDEFTRAGTVNFIDNQVKATTGTIRMRGEFQNPSGALKPGLFARIRLPIGAAYGALLIPDEALLSDQGRKFVYIVKKTKDDRGTEADRVEYHKVKYGQAIHGLRVIKEGVAEGDRVIIQGQQRVRAGTQVQAALQAPPGRPQSPLGKLLNDDGPADAPKGQVAGGQ